MVFFIAILIVVSAALIYLWIKSVNVVFDPLIKIIDRRKKRLPKTDNPYINAHRLKIHNDALYDEYLEWLDKQGGDIPFEKWKTDEERAFERKLTP